MTRLSVPIVAATACLATLLNVASAAENQGGAARAASAQSARNAATKLEEIAVTATRSERAVGDVPMAVTILQSDEIERSPSKTLDELLRTSPSFTLFRRSSSVAADPSSQGVKLRNVGGSGISRALVLVDGIPANDPFGGWVAWRAVPRLGLQRIEIVPGGGSALYGNYALGGVIQAFSRPIEPNEADLSAEYGTSDTMQVAARAADRWGSVGGALEGEYFESHGYPVVADYARGAIDGDTPSRHTTLNGRLEIRPNSRLGIDLKGSYFDEDLNAGTQYTTAALQRLEVSGSARYTTDGAGVLDLTLFGHDGEFQQNRARVGPGRNTEVQSAQQDVPTSDLGAGLLWNSPPLNFGGTHSITVGTDARSIDGTTHETLYPTPASLPGNPTVQRDAGGEQRLLGVFAQDIYDYSDAVSASLALRYDRWQNLSGSRVERAYDGTETSTDFDDRSDEEFSPKAGLRVRVNDWLATRGTVYRSFRAPTLDELYRPFQVGTVRTESNENLSPETVRGAEVGFDLGGYGGPTARLTAFWNEMQDPIVNVSTGANTRQRQNLGEARIQGFEVDGSWAFAPHWSAGLAYTLATTEVTEAPGQPQLLGKQLPQAPEDMARLSLSFDDPGLLTINLQVRYIGKQYENDINTLPMEDVVLTDVFASGHLTERLDLFVAVENVFDETYLVGRSGVDTIGQPRFVHGGFRLRFGR
jgi:outer membrane receptor protein involved in Fe transport